MTEKVESGAGIKFKLPDFEFEAYVKDSEFDKDQERRKPGVEASGRDDGYNEIPHSSASSEEMSSVERDIVGLCQDRLDLIAKKASYALNHLSDLLKSEFKKLEETNDSGNSKKIAQYHRHEIGKLKQSAKNGLVDAYKKERNSLKDLTYFKRRNGINRPAEYPESKILGTGMLLTVVLIETLVNAYFFAQGSQLGLFGGALQAALVSVVNVSWSFVMAVIAYRGLHHRVPFKKLASILGVFLHIVVAVGICLAVAHYRDLLTIDTDRAMELTVRKMRADPFGLATLDAVLLFVIGLVIALIAVWKGYTFDDRYPGYGAIDRRYLLALEDFRDVRDSIDHESNDVLSSAFRQFDVHMDLLKQRSKNINSIYSSMQSIEGRFEGAQKGIQNARNTLVATYREENKAIRNSTPPQYFNHELGDLTHAFDLPKLDALSIEVESTNEMTDIALKATAEEREKLQIQVENLRKDVDKLQQAAIEEASEQNRADRKFREELPEEETI